MDLEQNIYLAIQALRLKLIDTSDFVAAFHDWTTDKSLSITDLLVDDGHISAEQRTALHHMLDNDVEAGVDLSGELAEMADLRIRDALRLVKDSDIQLTLAGLEPAEGVQVDDAGAPTKPADRYQISRQYSEGALGRIWLAEDQDLKREVVLKELHPSRAKEPATRRRFLNEAKITGQLEHPNIVPVYELGYQKEEGRLYYTMRFVRGETFKDAIARYHKRGRDVLESRRLLGVFVSVCNAIAYAHSRGVIHRDLKPENVVLGSFGEAVLLDWGLAKIATENEPTDDAVTLDAGTDPSLTAVGAVLGTPAYMAPEQAAGDSERIDGRTDVYGLGAILYEITTGHAPHDGTDVIEVVRRIASEPSPAPRATNRSIAPALDAICVKAMAKEPTDRYATATAVAEDVQRLLADEPVSAYPEPFRARAARWVRRNRGTTAAATIVLLSIGVALLNLWWQRTNAISQELELLGRQNRQASGRLQALVQILRDDVEYLAGFPSVEPLLEQQGTQDPPLRAELAMGFAGFLEHRKTYFQARLIGRDGQEIVRVERKPGDAPKVRLVDLPNKQTKEYFDTTMGLPRGSIYLSKVELNQENNKVAVPRMPVIRAAVPIFLEGPARQPGPGADGIVIINIMFEPLFEMLRGDAGKGTSPRHVYVTNPNGYFLWGTDDRVETFAFDEPNRTLDGPARIQECFPEFGPFFADRGTTDDHALICEDEPVDRAVNVYKLHFDPSRPERFLGLVVDESYETLQANAQFRYRLPMYATWALIVALVVTLLWVVVRARIPSTLIRQLRRNRE